MILYSMDTKVHIKHIKHLQTNNNLQQQLTSNNKQQQRTSYKQQKLTKLKTIYLFDPLPPQEFYQNINSSPNKINPINNAHTVDSRGNLLHLLLPI